MITISETEDVKWIAKRGQIEDMSGEVVLVRVIAAVVGVSTISTRTTVLGVERSDGTSYISSSGEDRRTSGGRELKVL